MLAPVVALLLSSCSILGAQGAAVPSTDPDGPLYISIGDSYAAGYQPSAGGGSTTTGGFAYQLAGLGTPQHGKLHLVNFGCSGATTTKIVSEDGCEHAALGPGGSSYDTQPQAAAALDMMRQHPQMVALVTIVMGGNDVQPCLQVVNPRQCVERTIPEVRDNISGLVVAIRQVVGPDVPVVGLTYPDPYLGGYIKGDATSMRVAADSLELFRKYLNPTLKDAYGSAQGRFVDITAATGAYGSFSETVDLAPYGILPRPVAQACRLTFYCAAGDVHPTTEGYALIAERVRVAAGG